MLKILLLFDLDYEELLYLLFPYIILTLILLLFEFIFEFVFLLLPNNK
jgi:hypothetical protein